MDKTTVMAYFSIHGEDFEIDNVTQMLGIKPTEKKVKGSIPEGRKRPCIETSWKLSTEEEQSHDVNEQLRQLTDLLDDKKEILRDIRMSMDVDFDFVIVVKIENGEKPAMHFHSETLSLISYLKADIDIDIYIYS